jgi:flagellar basal body-associated protein FliL
VAHKSYARAKNPLPKRNPLPLILMGIALVLVAVGAFFLFGRSDNEPPKPVETAGRPNLAVDREQIDFGKVPVEQVVKSEFELSNTGDQPLQILGAPQVEVREGC